MDTLKEIVDVVTRNKVKKIEVIGNPNDKGTKLQKFYDAIREGKISTDEEAFQLLYNGEGDKNAFHKLKYVLKERLINTLFFIDTKTNKYSDIQATYFQCAKEILAIEILGMRNATKVSIPMAEKLLATTLKYDFTDFSIMLSRKLASHYAQRLGDRKKFEAYNNLLEELSQLNLKEVLAERRYRDIVSYYVRDKSTKSFIASIAQQYDDEVSALKTKRSSSKLVHQVYMLKIAKVMSENDYKSTILLCRDALSELEHFPVLNVLAVLGVTYQLIASCIHLKRYEEAKEGINRCLVIQEEGRPNWFKAHELYMTLCLHTRRYDEAFDIHESVTAHKGFMKIPATWRETWKVFEAWLHLLQSAGLCKGSLQSKSFKVNRFLNEVPTFSKDKRGMNVPVLIVQLTIALQAQKFDLLVNRVEALSKYSVRYLDRENNFRSNCFIRMIIEMEKQHFRKQPTIKQTANLLADMSSEPIDISNQSHDIEIIPLEDSWEYIVSFLPDKGFVWNKPALQL